MTNTSTALKRHLLAPAVLMLSILLSAQALAFDVGGLSYTILNATDVEVTGRAAGNTDTDIVIPATVVDSGITYDVKTVGYAAFDTNALTSVIIPDSVTFLSGFGGNALTSVIIPDSVTTIGRNAFNDNALTSVIIPDSVTTIGDSAFPGNALTSVIIPDSVTTIGDFAFTGSGLTSVIIADSVTTIGEFAFYNNALTSVTIPDSVEAIGLGAFGLNALTSAVFGGNFGGFQLDMFEYNADLATITYAQGASGWDAPLRVFTADTGPTGSVTAEAAASSAATPVPTSPLWLLGIMAGLLSLVAVRKLRKS
jgi:hypothetical protein